MNHRVSKSKDDNLAVALNCLKSNSNIQPANASAQLSGRYEWGGEESTFSFGASASISNDDGDKIEVTFEQNSDGSGSIEVIAEAASEDDKQ